MSLNAYLNSFRSVKCLRRVMSWNAWEILMVLFSVLRVFWQNNVLFTVENTSWKPREMPFLRLLISKCPKMPEPSRTCAFGGSSNAAYYSLSAWYLKSFWQPCIILTKREVKMAGCWTSLFLLFFFITTTTTTTNFIENWKITNYITFPPANSLWTNRGGGSWRHITKQDLYIDGLNNSEDTTIQ